MLNHLGFLQYPIKEQCPFRQTCMEVQLQKCLAAKQKRYVHCVTVTPIPTLMQDLLFLSKLRVSQ